MRQGGSGNQSQLGETSRLLEEGQVDLRAFPAFARARPLSATLAPGDALFIPAGFWHHIAAAGSTEANNCVMSVNFWWQ